jgi:hypothetical protein
MNDLTGSQATDMSCPLLDKLAPETPILIYEYVSSFGTPVKHATNLQPFLQKLTEVKSNSAVESVEEDMRSIGRALAERMSWRYRLPKQSIS